MARPYKQTVDYFPHDTDASEGKTLTIIQAKYGNDGYAFWFKLLQLLGKSNGLYYDFNNPPNLEFLSAKTHQNDTETTKDILETLSVLGAIDEELYKCGFIWCQKLADRVEDAFNRTEKGVPQRPDYLVNVADNDVNVPYKDVNVNTNSKKATETQQRKLKETKLNNTILPDFIDNDIWNNYLAARKKKPTEQAVVLLVKKLTEYRAAGDDPNEVLKRSIMNGWTGIFPLDKKGNSRSTEPKPKSKFNDGWK